MNSSGAHPGHHISTGAGTPGPQAQVDDCYAPAEPVERDAGWHRAAGQARLLSWLSLAYMTAEARAQKAVAITFFLLAPYISYDAITILLAQDRAWTSWLGIGLSIASLVIMPLLGLAKKRLGARLDSRATAGEGTQNLLCAYLAAAVLVGLLANIAFG